MNRKEEASSFVANARRAGRYADGGHNYGLRVNAILRHAEKVEGKHVPLKDLTVAHFHSLMKEKYDNKDAYGLRALPTTLSALRAHVAAAYVDARIPKKLEWVHAETTDDDLKAVLEQAVRERKIPPKTQKPCAKHAEMMKVNEWLQRHDPDAAKSHYVQLALGCRVGALQGLKVGHFKLRNDGTVYAEYPAKKYTGKKLLKHGEAPAKKEIDEQEVVEFFEEILADRNEEEQLLSNHPTKYEESLRAALTQTGLYDKYGKTLGLTHAVRHTAAQHSRNKGASKKQIADELGHTSLESQKSYGRLAANNQKKRSRAAKAKKSPPRTPKKRIRAQTRRAARLRQRQGISIKQI